MSLNHDLAAAVADEETTRRLVGDAMREDKLLPHLAWRDLPTNKKTASMASRLDIGDDNYIVLREETGQVWCYAFIEGMTGGVFIAGPLDNAKLLAIAALADKARRAADILNLLKEKNNEIQ